MSDGRAAAHNILAVVFILAAIVLSMGRLRSAAFTNWDDTHTISENAWFEPPTFATLGEIWSRPNADLYVPVTYSFWWTLSRFSYSIDNVGDITQNPHVFHVANIVLHAVTALYVFALLRRLLHRPGADSRGAYAGALAAAMLFAVHPVQVESVAWASGTKDVLCGLFSTLAIWQYVKYAQLAGNASRKEALPMLRRTIARHYILAFAAFILAILSKPTAVAIPLMLLPLEGFILQRGVRATARGIVPMLLISLAAVIAARAFQAAIGLTNLVPWYQRPPVALDAIAFYLYKLFIPVRLVFDYGRSPRTVIDSGMYHWTWIVPVVALLLCWISRKRAPDVIAGAGVFVFALLPVLGLTAFDFQEYSTVADHYLYLPMLGVALIVGGIIVKVRARWALVIASAACAAMLVLLMLRTSDQTKYWMNTEVLMRHTIAVNPNSWVSYTNLGSELSAHDRNDEALELEYRALAIRSENPDAHMNIGTIKLEQGDLASATQHFETALRSRRSTEGHTNLANAYGQAGRFDDAIAQFQKALELDPKNRRARRMLERTQAHLRSLQSTIRRAGGATTQPKDQPSTRPATNISQD